MANANFGGLAGVAIGGAVGYGVGHLLGTMGRPPLDSFAWGSVAGCFSTSMFGLLYDRSVVPEFRKSYKTLTRHLARRERSGPDYDPRERMAFFGLPIAFATFVIPVVAAILGLIAWNVARHGGGNGELKPESFAIYFLAGIAGVALTMIVGNATADHRLLQREISFNTTPLAESAQQAPVHAAHGPDLDRIRSRGRIHALISIALGFLLLALNHYFAVHDHTYYPKALFGGPMIIMVGIFGLFEPRIMSRHLPTGKSYPSSVLLLMLLAMAIGAVAGWQLQAWYQG
jgi:hypothetical protein